MALKRPAQEVQPQKNMGESERQDRFDEHRKWGRAGVVFCLFLAVG